MPKRTQRMWFLTFMAVAAALVALAVFWFRTLGLAEGLIVLAVVLVLSFSFGRGRWRRP